MKNHNLNRPQKNKRALLAGLALVGLALGMLLSGFPVQASPLGQIPTGTIATVTSTPSGPVVTVKLDINQPQINVRAGPGTTYDKVGVLLLGQQAVAKGRTIGGDWIEIAYDGVQGGLAWVHSSLVNITPGELPVVEPPSLPTPLVTVTIDPTMAAQFVVTVAPTRLPTFTAPAPLTVPTYAEEPATGISNKLPMGMVIIGLAAVGIFLGLFALAQGR